ncbi:TPA: hypothetical protein ACGCAJ_004732 [Serratia marcescens]
MQTIYGVVMSNGSHCDTSLTEQGAKIYATRHGYTQVTARRRGGMEAEIIAHRDGKKWKPGPAPFVITKPGDYVTRDGRRVTVHAIVYQNSAGVNVTFPIKGAIWRMFRGAERPRGLDVWQANGLFNPRDPCDSDIVGPWVEGGR